MVPRFEKSFLPNHRTHPARKTSKFASLLSIVWDLTTRRIYQSRKRILAREEDFLQIKQLVINVRMQMPRLATRKLYYLIQDDLKRLNIKLGRDALFDYLRR